MHFPFHTFLSDEVVYRLGSTLVHSLWQIAALGLLIAAVLGLLLRNAAPNARYVTACCGLAAMVAGPIATYLLVVPPKPPMPTAPALGAVVAQNPTPSVPALSEQAEPRSLPSSPNLTEVNPTTVPAPPSLPELTTLPSQAALTSVTPAAAQTSEPPVGRLQPHLPWIVSISKVVGLPPHTQIIGLQIPIDNRSWWTGVVVSFAAPHVWGAGKHRIQAALGEALSNEIEFEISFPVETDTPDPGEAIIGPNQPPEGSVLFAVGQPTTGPLAGRNPRAKFASYRPGNGEDGFIKGRPYELAIRGTGPLSCLALSPRAASDLVD